MTEDEKAEQEIRDVFDRQIWDTLNPGQPYQEPCAVFYVTPEDITQAVRNLFAPPTTKVEKE